MKHLGTVTIETERLVLRRFTPDDAEAGFRNWMSDSRVTEFLRWPTHQSVDVSQRVLAQWIADYAKPDVYQWAIELRELGEPIGSISAVGMDERTEMIHIGYCIGSRWWRQGYTSEALAAVIRFFIREVGVKRIEALHDPQNPNSGRVMRKCGMTYEGTLRKADWNNRGIVDACMYSLLAEEYEAGEKNTHQWREES